MNIAEIIKGLTLQIATEMAKREHTVTIRIVTNRPDIRGAKLRVTHVLTTLLRRMSAGSKQGAGSCYRYISTRACL